MSSAGRCSCRSAYRTFAATHPDQSRYFQPILDVLDYAPSKLELVPAVVMVEGKNDYYSARLAQQVLGVQNSLRFMPGGGAGSLDQLIALYIGWAREFVVLLDSDDEGTRQRARYIEKFGAAVAERIFTLGDLVPSMAGKSLEGAYQVADRSSLVLALGRESTHPTDKKNLNRLVQEALVRRAALKLSAQATAVFSTLLSELDARLNAVSRG